MREIKFRVWDKQAKGYIDRKSNVIGFDGEVSEIECGDVVQYAIQENYVLEQYTGLKDKNGVEIYENDIIHVQSNLYKDHIGAIIWSQGTPGFCISDNTNEFNIPRPLGMQIDGFLSYEVIGNIHENPDLLEEQ